MDVGLLDELVGVVGVEWIAATIVSMLRVSILAAMLCR